MVDKYERMIYYSFFFNVRGLKPDNVEKIFERNFRKWQVMGSSKVTINGEEIKQDKKGMFERAMLLAFPNEQGNSNIESLNINQATEKGFPLTTEMFISEEISKYEVLKEAKYNGLMNREKKAMYNYYFDFLKKEQKATEQTVIPQQDIEQMQAGNPEQDNSGSKLTYKQIALIYYYNGVVISESVNAPSIIKKFGKNSSKTLYNKYTEVNRQRDLDIDSHHCTIKTRKEDIHRIYEYLTPKGKERASEGLKRIENFD